MEVTSKSNDALLWCLGAGALFTNSIQYIELYLLCGSVALSGCLIDSLLSEGDLELLLISVYEGTVFLTVHSVYCTFGVGL